VVNIISHAPPTTSLQTGRVITSEAFGKSVSFVYGPLIVDLNFRTKNPTYFANTLAKDV